MYQIQSEGSHTNVRIAVHISQVISLGQNGQHFPDDFLKCIFLYQNIWISIQISQKCVPKGSINNKSALVQVMAWRRTGDKTLPEPMPTQFTDAYMRH